MSEYIKIAVLDNEVQAQHLDATLKERNIPQMESCLIILMPMADMKRRKPCSNYLIMPKRLVPMIKLP